MTDYTWKSYWLKSCSWGCRVHKRKPTAMAFCHLHFFFPMELITFYLRIFLSPLCQRGSPCKSTLMTACPCCSTRQLSDRTVFQWILKAMVATSDFKSQRHKVLDKQGRCIAAGGKCAMKSLGNHVVYVPEHCCGNELRWPRQRANIRYKDHLGESCCLGLEW